MKIPQWAQELTINALLWWERQGNEAPNVSLEWRHRQGVNTTGKAVTGKAVNCDIIRITAGENRLDQKLVLLHEIAHTLVGVEPIFLNIERAKKNGWVFGKEPTEPIVIGNRSHTPHFWNIVWQLYHWAKIPIRYALIREGNYRKGALVAYRNNKKSPPVRGGL